MDPKDIFNNDFGLTTIPKKDLKRQEVYNLFKKPLKETKEQAPRFYNFEENDTHMADVLFLPNDRAMPTRWWLWMLRPVRLMPSP